VTQTRNALPLSCNKVCCFFPQMLKVLLSVLRRTPELLMGQICAALGNPEPELVSVALLHIQCHFLTLARQVVVLTGKCAGHQAILENGCVVAGTTKGNCTLQLRVDCNECCGAAGSQGEKRGGQSRTALREHLKRKSPLDQSSYVTHTHTSRLRI